MVTDPRKHIEVRKGVDPKPSDRTKLSKQFTKLHMQEQRLLQEAIDRGLMKPLSEWDLEELAHGKPRNQHGNFGGKAPAWITPHVVQEIRKRLLDESYGRMASHIGVAIQTLVQLMTSTETDVAGNPLVSPSVRLQAAKYVIDQTMGQPVQSVELTGLESSYQDGRKIALIEEAKKAMLEEKHIIEGRVVEDE